MVFYSPALLSHPAGKGQRGLTIQNLLCTVPASQKQDWTSCSPQVHFCYNTTTHQSMGESLFYRVLGQEPQLAVDFLLGRDQDPVLGGCLSIKQAYYCFWLRSRVVDGGCWQMGKKIGQEANPGSLEPVSSPGGEGPCRGGRSHTIAPANDQHKVRNVKKSWSCCFPTESTSSPALAALDGPPAKVNCGSTVQKCPINHPQLFQVLCVHHYLLYPFLPIAFSHAPLTDLLLLLAATMQLYPPVEQ